MAGINEAVTKISEAGKGVAEWWGGKPCTNNHMSCVTSINRQCGTKITPRNTDARISHRRAGQRVSMGFPEARPCDSLPTFGSKEQRGAGKGREGTEAAAAGWNLEF